MQYIYIIKNKINNKFYVGRTNDFKRRKRNHISLLRRNKHHSIHLQNAWNKYGEINFDFYIYQEFNCHEAELEDRLSRDVEQKFIDMYINTNSIYNRSRTAEKGVVIKGKDHHFYGKHPREWTGEAFDKEIDRKKTLTKEKNHFYGKKHTDETKRKISEKQKGKIPSKETREKISKAGMGRLPTVSQKVEIDGILYNTISDASKAIGLSRTTIRLRALDDRFPNYRLI